MTVSLGFGVYPAVNPDKRQQALTIPRQLLMGPQFVTAHILGRPKVQPAVCSIFLDAGFRLCKV